MRSILLKAALLAVPACLVLAGLYFLPPIQSRVAWRLAALQSRLFYILYPPEKQAFAPASQVEAAVQATLRSLAAIQTATAETIPPRPAAITSTPPATGASPTPAASQAPAAANVPWPTPIPAKKLLGGFRFEYQTFNNCGPANLAMALSYWNWQGDQRTTKAALRPNDDDANVLPEELAQYAAAQPGLKAALRVGGDLDLLKRLLAAGFPVVIESGHQPAKDWWMGHYVVISGYDDGREQLVSQDSLIMPDLPVPYAEIQQRWWRDFNYLYLVIYPGKREGEVFSILGPDADPQENRRRALEKAAAETPVLSGRDLFFALYNQGDNHLALGDFQAAAESYDLAFGLYGSIDEKDRPWRTLWYRPGPYVAYYRVGRYQDTIDLADSVLAMLSKRGLEESHYWRGLSYEALGNPDKAIFDYQIALKLKPGYTLAQEALARLAGK